MKVLAVACALLALVAAGCSSNKKSTATATTTTPPPTTAIPPLPPARTADVWARRVVDLLFRPLNQDLLVVSNFDSPRIRIFIETGNQVTLRAIRTRMGDLSQCTAKLDAIGRPPARPAALTRVYTHLRAACRSYVTVAKTLLTASQMLSSGKTDVVKRGNDLARTAAKPSQTAAQELTAAIKIAQGLPAFRRAGLNPSV